MEANSPEAELVNPFESEETEQIIKLERPEIQIFETYAEGLLDTATDEIPSCSSQYQDPLGSGPAVLQDEPSVPTNSMEDTLPSDQDVLTEMKPTIYVASGVGDELLVDHELEQTAETEYPEEEQQQLLTIVDVTAIEGIITEDPDNLMLEAGGEETSDVELKPTIVKTERQSELQCMDTMDESNSRSGADDDGMIVPHETDWRKEYRSHINKLSYLMRTPRRFQDVAFIVGPTKERILAHSFILLMNSAVFEEILSGNDNPDEEPVIQKEGIKEIILEDISLDVFKIILNFMYTEEVNVNIHNVEDVYKAAKKTFQIYELADQCQEILRNNISFGTAINILQLAEEFQEDELYKESLSFILQNGEIILHSEEFLHLNRKNLSEVLGSDHLAASELTIFQATLKWANNVCLVLEQQPTQQNLRTVLDEVIYKIRFPLMTAEEFKLDVVSANILLPTEIIDLFSYFTPPFQTVSSNFPFSTTPRLHNELEANVSNVDSVIEEDCTTRRDSSRSRRSSSNIDVDNNGSGTSSICSKRNAKRSKDDDNKAESSNTRRRGLRGRPRKITDRLQYAKNRKGYNGWTLKKRTKLSNDDDDGVINISSSGSDEDWKKSSEDSASDSSDADYVPKSLTRKPRQQSRFPALPSMPQMLPLLPINTSPGQNILGAEFIKNMRATGIKMPYKSVIPIPQLRELKSIKVDRNIKESKADEISTFIQRLINYKEKNTITKINEHLRIDELPKFRVCLPSIQDCTLSLTNGLLAKAQNITEFKETAGPLLRAMRELIFFGTSETNGGKVRNMELERVWTSGVKFNIILNGVRVFRSSLQDGDMCCCFVRSPALQSIINGIAYQQGSLKRLIIAECEFRLFPVVPTSALRFLTILKVSGLDGINNFLRRCTNLRELHWDGNGVGYRIITLDEDLNLFSPNCKLRKLVVSNALISTKEQPSTPAMVQLPLFFFCEFSPYIIQNFQTIFPSVHQIHFRNYPVVSFFEKLLDMESVVHIGIWGAKLVTEGQWDKVEAVNFTRFISHEDLKARIRRESIPNKVGKKFASHAFFLARRAKSDVNAGSLHWHVTETVRNAVNDCWKDEFLTKIYNAFQYSIILDYDQYIKLFRNNY